MELLPVGGGQEDVIAAEISVCEYGRVDSTLRTSSDVCHQVQSQT